jgi:2-polyprenyl-6-methoxyphenol hydroxylase-like FAD-dependent oxidoreductase
MTDHHDVVIAGAGPNGLMLACELALAGVRPVVLDTLPGPSDEPKANGLVGQVIRQLDMRGLYQTIGGVEGPPEPLYEWFFAAMPFNVAGIADNPMRALLIQQPRLVRLLEKRARDLGVDVRWGHQLTGVGSESGRVTVAVSTPERTYDVDATYLVGADGGRSVVRKSVGIDFPGSTSDTVARIAHVHMPDELRTAEGGYAIPGHGPLRFGHTRLDNGGFIFAQFSADRAMLGTIEFGRQPGLADTPVTLDEVRESAKRVLGVDVPVEAPRGPGPHALRRIDGQNSRQADRYRAGNVLLLGDAAHVHSAMGGPGLNLGMQDAVNLGWKLAAAVKGSAPEGLLDTYDSERRPVGERVMMQSLSQTALMAPGPEVGALRTLFGELLEQPGVAAHVAHMLAGSDVRYEVGDEHPLSGLLVPDLELDDGRRVAELLHDARPVLLDLSGGALTPAGSGWADRVDLVTGTIAGEPYGGMLIRPDGYVAWAVDARGASEATGGVVDEGEQARLRSALEHWFGPATT